MTTPIETSNPVKLAFAKVGYMPVGNLVDTHQETCVTINIDDKEFKVKLSSDHWNGFSASFESESRSHRLVQVSVHDSRVVLNITPPDSLALVDDSLPPEQIFPSYIESQKENYLNSKLCGYILSYVQDLMTEEFIENLVHSINKNKLNCPKEAVKFKSPCIIEALNIDNQIDDSSELTKALKQCGFYLWNSDDYVDYEMCVTFREGSERDRMDFCPHIELNRIDKAVSISLGINIGEGWEHMDSVLVDEATPWGDAVSNFVAYKISSSKLPDVTKESAEDIDLESYLLAAKLFPEEHQKVIKTLNDAFYKVVNPSC